MGPTRETVRLEWPRRGPDSLSLDDNPQVEPHPTTPVPWRVKKKETYTWIETGDYYRDLRLPWNP